jgi:hypothetical protein
MTYNFVLILSLLLKSLKEIIRKDIFVNILYNDPDN